MTKRKQTSKQKVLLKLDKYVCDTDIVVFGTDRKVNNVFFQQLFASNNDRFTFESLGKNK